MWNGFGVGKIGAIYVNYWYFLSRTKSGEVSLISCNFLVDGNHYTVCTQ